jgi:hypothetical protein
MSGSAIVSSYQHWQISPDIIGILASWHTRKSNTFNPSEAMKANGDSAKQILIGQSPPVSTGKRQEKIGNRLMSRKRVAKEL